jgi:cytochrome P450
MEMHADDPFSRSFEYASGATGERVQNPLWQITEIFVGQQLRKSITEVKRFGDRIVVSAVKARERQKLDGSEPREGAISAISGSLINSLLDSISDHKLVADAALNYLSAGRDTTAQALTWAFYLLMRHPKVVLRLRQELLPLSTTTVNGISRLESSQLRPTALPYTMAVFYETLRLYPPVPIELKQCEQATTLPDGTFLPKSAVVVWCIWAMNRSKLIWGEDPHLFLPQRWMDGGKLVTKSAYEFPVFNGGPRTCLGKKMAECIAAMVIARLIWEFDFEALDDKERISRNSLTLPMEGGLPCHARSRSRVIIEETVS